MIVLHWIVVAPYFRCPKRDHLFLVRKTLEILVKTFFFLRSAVFGRRNFTTLHEIFRSLQNRKSVIFELAPGPRKKIWINYSVFVWQRVNETKKVKNPCLKACNEFVGLEPISASLRVRETQLLSKKCRSGGETLATSRPI